MNMNFTTVYHFDLKSKKPMKKKDNYNWICARQHEWRLSVKCVCCGAVQLINILYLGVQAPNAETLL